MRIGTRRPLPGDAPAGPASSGRWKIIVFVALAVFGFLVFNHISSVNDSDNDIVFAGDDANTFGQKSDRDKVSFSSHEKFDESDQKTIEPTPLHTVEDWQHNNERPPATRQPTQQPTPLPSPLPTPLPTPTPTPTPNVEEKDKPHSPTPDVSEYEPTPEGDETEPTPELNPTPEFIPTPQVTDAFEPTPDSATESEATPEQETKTMQPTPDPSETTDEVKPTPYIPTPLPDAKDITPTKAENKTVAPSNYGTDENEVSLTHSEKLALDKGKHQKDAPTPETMTIEPTPMATPDHHSEKQKEEIGEQLEEEEEKKEEEEEEKLEQDILNSFSNTPDPETDKVIEQNNEAVKVEADEIVDNFLCAALKRDRFDHIWASGIGRSSNEFELCGFEMEQYSHKGWKNPTHDEAATDPKKVMVIDPETGEPPNLDKPIKVAQLITWEIHAYHTDGKPNDWGADCYEIRLWSDDEMVVGKVISPDPMKRRMSSRTPENEDRFPDGHIYVVEFLVTRPGVYDVTIRHPYTAYSSFERSNPTPSKAFIRIEPDGPAQATLKAVLPPACENLKLPYAPKKKIKPPPYCVHEAELDDFSSVRSMGPGSWVRISCKEASFCEGDDSQLQHGSLSTLGWLYKPSKPCRYRLFSPEDFQTVANGEHIFTIGDSTMHSMSETIAHFFGIELGRKVVVSAKAYGGAAKVASRKNKASIRSNEVTFQNGNTAILSDWMVTHWEPDKSWGGTISFFMANVKKRLMQMLGEGSDDYPPVSRLYVNSAIHDANLNSDFWKRTHESEFDVRYRNLTDSLGRMLLPWRESGTVEHPHDFMWRSNSVVTFRSDTIRRMDVVAREVFSEQQVPVVDIMATTMGLNNADEKKYYGDGLHFHQENGYAGVKCPEVLNNRMPCGEHYNGFIDVINTQFTLNYMFRDKLVELEKSQ